MGQTIFFKKPTGDWKKNYKGLSIPRKAFLSYATGKKEKQTGKSIYISRARVMF